MATSAACAESFTPAVHALAAQAVAGEDPNISVISVAEARITHLLQGAWPVHRL